MRTKNYFLILVAILAIFLSACSAAVAQEKEPVTRTINVSGSAQAFVSPDIAHITIGVHTEGENAAAAMDENSLQAQAVIDMLKEQGIAARDIRTSNLSIYPSTEFDKDGNQTGVVYIVENNVYVTIRNLDRTGEILDAVVESGANNIYGIQFDVADREAALSQARLEAVAKARQTAEELATAAGVVLGEVHTINVYGGAPSPVYMGYEFAVREADMAAMPPVSGGEISISVEVNVVYEIH